MKKQLLLILILLFSAGIFTHCKKDNGNPPVLPPQESIIIDFSNFYALTKSGSEISGQKGTENSHWDFAATVAGVWRLLITTTLAVPVNALKLAVDKDPVFLSDKTWQWSYNASVLSVAYKVRLTGQISATDVLWKMYITKDVSGSAEFLWLNGTSKLDGTGGQWTIYESSQSPAAMLQIEWEKTNATVGKVTYTYMKNDAYKNNYIEYGLTNNTLNAYYTIRYYNGVKLSDVSVEWSTTNKNGRVKSLDYLVGNTWYCWNEQKVNTSCP